MKMPGCDRSVIPDQKITDYLLSNTHTTGKARFFKRFGFDVAYMAVFKDALRQHSVDRDNEHHKATGFGIKYKLTCEINTPYQRNPCIVTVWVNEAGEDIPKFVTACPN
jgi:hypothetical protein